MKKLALTLFLVLGSMTIQAQELTWQTDMNKAMELSKKEKKPLLLLFFIIVFFKKYKKLY